jgi:hypothetical protein
VPANRPELDPSEAIGTVAELDRLRALGVLIARGTVGSGSLRRQTYIDEYEGAFVSRTMNGANTRGLRVLYIRNVNGRVDELGERGQIGANRFLITAKVDGIWYWVGSETSPPLRVGTTRTFRGANPANRVSEWCRFSWCPK